MSEALDNPKIPFTTPTVIGSEREYIEDAINNQSLSGGGKYYQKCVELLKSITGAKYATITNSGTSALEIAALVLNIQKDDEIIMPSYTFTSTANAFMIFGAKIKFVDIRDDTCNIDEKLIEQAITTKTKAIVIVDYGSVAVEYDEIIKVAKQYKIPVIADSAQSICAFYKNKPLGSIADMTAFSFHETKNITAGGEGGAFATNNNNYASLANVIVEKGTNRIEFLNGQVDKYTWVNRGSSYLPAEINTAYLYPSLLNVQKITDYRLSLWSRYYQKLEGLAKQGHLSLPIIPSNCQPNGHIFYIKLVDYEMRIKLSQYLRNHNIYASFHYVPLHSTEYGLSQAEFIGEDNFTTQTYQRLLRLPIHNQMNLSEVDLVCQKISDFFNCESN